MMKIGICVGHSRRGDKGAESVGDVSEWDYNRNVAAELYAELKRRGIDSFVINDYRAGSYRAAIRNAAQKLRELGATHAIELHFNSAGPTAHGCETLYWHSSTGGKRFAESINNAIVAEFDVRNRGIKPKRSGDRGSMFLRQTHCPAIIAEPFFGSSSKDWNTFQTAEARLAYAYANGIESIA